MSRRRGGLLLETLVALAILVMVGLFALAGARRGLDATDRAARRAAAVDLAASRLAEIEAGIIDIDAVGDLNALPATLEGRLDEAPPRWPFVIEVTTGPSEFPGLVRAEVLVIVEEEDEAVELARLAALVEDGGRPLAGGGG